MYNVIFRFPGDRTEKLCNFIHWCGHAKQLAASASVAGEGSASKLISFFCDVPSNIHIVWYVPHGLPHILNGKLYRIRHFLLNLDKLYGTIARLEL